MTHGLQIDELCPTVWAPVARSFEDYSIYQTRAFGECSAADTGSQILRVAVREGDAFVGAAQIRVKRIPWTSTGLAYVYFGPMTRRPGLPDRFGEVVAAIREEFCERRGLGLRMVPNRRADAAGDGPWGAAGLRRVESPPPYRTFVVNLSPDADTLRRNLAQKWRNGLNQAEKRGVSIEARTDEAAMADFERLYDQMWSRKQFETGVAVSSFGHLQELLPDDEKMTIHLAYDHGALVAGHVSSTLGDCCIFLLGASNDAGRDCKASYALQWHALTAARARGMRWYDLGGTDPASNPGVHHFKAGLGGVETTFVGVLEGPARGLGRYTVPMAEWLYCTLRPGLRRGKKSPPSAVQIAGTGGACSSLAK